jgi:hypothetical protein
MLQKILSLLSLRFNPTDVIHHNKEQGIEYCAVKLHISLASANIFQQA